MPERMEGTPRASADGIPVNDRLFVAESAEAPSDSALAIPVNEIEIAPAAIEGKPNASCVWIPVAKNASDVGVTSTL